MKQAVAVIVTALLGGGAQTVPAPLPMSALQVPAAALPSGCVLSPAASESANGRFRGGLWANLPIGTNPWFGSDAEVIATIRERIRMVPMTPDIPATRSEAARYRQSLANGIDEGYAAVYRGPGIDLIVVYALRPRAGQVLNGPGAGIAERFDVGGLIVRMVGTSDTCAPAIAGHLRSLTRKPYRVTPHIGDPGPTGIGPVVRSLGRPSRARSKPPATLSAPGHEQSASRAV